MGADTNAIVVIISGTQLFVIPNDHQISFFDVGNGIKTSILPKGKENYRTKAFPDSSTFIGSRHIRPSKYRICSERDGTGRVQVDRAWKLRKNVSIKT